MTGQASRGRRTSNCRRCPVALPELIELNRNFSARAPSNRQERYLPAKVDDFLFEQEIIRAEG
jgi:hypothetical protein